MTGFMRRLLLCLFLLLPINGFVQAVEQDYKYQVIYPGAVEKSRSSYVLELLELALSYSSYQFEIKGSGGHFPTPRNFTFLSKQQEINILWTATSISRERSFLAVEIPLLKGLLGLRLPLVLAENKQGLDAKNLTQLRKYSAGQLLSWVDAKVLKYNGIEVTGSPTYPALFNMLAAKRFDYFPRSVTEVWAEIEHNKEFQLAVADGFAIYYPTAMYFFVNKANHFLHQEVKQGLEQAKADGSFDELFAKYHQVYLDKSKLQQRHLIRLNNPYYSSDKPVKVEDWLNN